VTVELVVDAPRWRGHLHDVRQATPGLVPVAKGNGYGFGVTTLAREASGLGVDTLAVGTYPEVAAAAEFPGSVLVLSPWRPGDPLGEPRVVHTVSRLDDLAHLAAGTGGTAGRARAVVEVLTSMRRHGIDPHRLAEAGPLLDAVDLVGWSLHLPLAGDTAAEAGRLGELARAVRPAPVWVSHVPPERLADVGPGTRLRVGTGLWLGRPDALTVHSRVLDVHRLGRGETFGYRQRRAPRAGVLVVVSGGTAHGIALRGPSPAVTLRQRGVTLAEAGLEASGRARSPFVLGGRYAGFAEPPHMQCSMVWLPAGAPVPTVGDRVPVRVRLTTALVDHIRWE
jgi:alanine racemase